MKLKTILFVCLLIFTTCKQEELSVEVKELLLKRMTVEGYTYNYSYNNKVLDKISLKIDGGEFEIPHITYNYDKGVLTEKNIYFPTRLLQKKETFVYENFRIKQVNTFFADAMGVLSQPYSSLNTYTGDLLTSVKEYTTEGKLLESKTYQYSARGDIIKVISYGYYDSETMSVSNNVQDTRTEEYEYDNMQAPYADTDNPLTYSLNGLGLLAPKHNVVRATHWFAYADMPVQKIYDVEMSYDYNSAGLPVKKTVKQLTDPSVIISTTYEYQYQ